MTDEPDKLIAWLRRSRFVFAYKLSDDERKLPTDQQRAILRLNFERLCDGYFKDTDSLPVATYRNEPTRY